MQPRSFEPRVGLFVFAAILVSQLWLVGNAGTDVPWLDAWDIEGAWLYPRWLAGELSFSDLFQAHNGHRIVWTHLLNLGLFAANGQWDPLLQLAASAVLNAAAAGAIAGIAAAAVPAGGSGGRWACVLIVTLFFLPHLAWHDVLWGFQTQVYLTVLFAIAAAACLTGDPGPRRIVAGIALGIGAAFAMGAGTLVGVGLLAVAWRRQAPLLPAVVILAAGLASRLGAGNVGDLAAQSAGDFGGALGRMLAWPYTWSPWAAIPMNLPLVLGLARRRPSGKAEDFIVALALWSVACAGAIAFSRSGGPEFAAGVPSRYVPFLVPLPLANAWFALSLIGFMGPMGLMGPMGRRGLMGRIGVIAWFLALLAGWAGLSADVLRGVVVPRIRDTHAPVRVMQAYQEGRDRAFIEAQPRLLRPHDDTRSVDAVLDNPAMRGRLPPSLQPRERAGPLSRFLRALLQRD